MHWQGSWQYATTQFTAQLLQRETEKWIQTIVGMIVVVYVQGRVVPSNAFRLFSSIRYIYHTNWIRNIWWKFSCRNNLVNHLESWKNDDDKITISWLVSCKDTKYCIVHMENGLFWSSNKRIFLQWFRFWFQTSHLHVIIHLLLTVQRKTVYCEAQKSISLKTFGNNMKQTSFRWYP